MDINASKSMQINKCEAETNELKQTKNRSKLDKEIFILIFNFLSIIVNVDNIQIITIITNVYTRL